MNAEYLLLAISAICFALFVALIWLTVYVAQIYWYVTGEGESRIIEAIRRKITRDDKEVYQRDPYLEAYEGDADVNKRINTVRG